mmetsp:Transcript_2781/g.4486  ORF Transcript_2781/g.4486 Transcript_2781/m.4486 type:complete len:311 (-) Transcript_2781:390-1322(-)
MYKKCFTGQEAVAAFMNEYTVSQKDAVQFGKLLVKQRILHHVCDDHDFEDTANLFYRLQCYHTPNILNSYRIWSERVDPNALQLVKILRTLLGKIESAVTDDHVGTVNYKKATIMDGFDVFEEAVCELQKVDMLAMNDATRTAFGINVYNLMIKYAFMKVGIPVSNLQRSSFFSSVSMNIGGHEFSFSDLENGVLRSNRKAPYTLSKPFQKADPRLAMAVKTADCRLHFALNCGAKSCPPVKNFTADALEEELRIVALSFFEQDDNVRLGVDSRTLYLSMILSWYRGDFSGRIKELPATIVGVLRGDAKQ